MNRQESVGLMLSLVGGLGYFFGILDQLRGMGLAILGFVILYVQLSTPEVIK